MFSVAEPPVLPREGQTDMGGADDKSPQMSPSWGSSSGPEAQSLKVLPELMLQSALESNEAPAVPVSLLLRPPPTPCPSPGRHRENDSHRQGHIVEGYQRPFHCFLSKLRVLTPLNLHVLI